ncbi:MAG TPA: alpha/beta fold hydrolase [Clostridia bacterium]
MRSSKRSNVGCLLIHGFGGSLEEVAPMAKKLSEEGFKVVCPVLKGHTGVKNDLGNCTYLDWIISAEEGFEALRKECDKFFIVGFSMGGLIALQLSQKYKLIGVATLNTPIYYWDFRQIADNIKRDIINKRFDSIKRYINSGNALPFKALVNFRILLSKTKRILGNTECPLFVAQALKDDTVRKASARYILNGVSSERKVIRFYENSGHQILKSEDAEKVMDDVLGFINELLG